MFLKEFNLKPQTRINKLNKLLSEQYGLNVSVLPKAKLQKLNEASEQALLQIRGSNKKFQLDPDYAKYLGLRDLTDVMLDEGVYADSPAYESMCNEIKERVKTLMDSGCTNEEAASQCMNEYRKDGRYAYEDAVIMPMVEMACEDYMRSCAEDKMDLNAVVDEIALEDQMQVALESGDTDGARSIMAQLREKKAKPDFLDVDGDGDKAEPMKKAVKDKEKKNESMFDDLISDILNEEVDVEQAEVVMAVRALADDIQGHVERIGRMMNEDVPAIADQMRAEMGASAAQQWADSTNSTLTAYMESAKGTKASMDQQVAGLTGEEQVGGLGDTGMEEPGLPTDDMGMEPELPVDDVPAAAGPTDEPLGRAEI
jgi:hypothetical protein